MRRFGPIALAKTATLDDAFQQLALLREKLAELETQQSKTAEELTEARASEKGDTQRLQEAAEQIDRLERAVESHKELSQRRKGALDTRSEQIARLTTHLEDRRNLVLSFRDRQDRYVAARRHDHLSSYTMANSFFAIAVEAAEVPAPDFVFAHEDFSLTAAVGYADSATLVADNVEYPDHRGRIHLPETVGRVASDAANQAILAHKVTSLNRASHVFASSEGQREALQALGVNAPLSVLHNCRNGADESAQSPIRTQCDVADGQRLILYLNNAYAGSGVEETVAAVAALNDGSHLAFLGAERLGASTSITELVSEAGIGDRVSALPLVAPQNLVEFASGADCIVIPFPPSNPNYQTCLPNRIFEAIAARVPVVAHAGTATGAFVAEHGIGAVFEEMVPAQIVDAIVSATDGEREGALASAADAYNWTKEKQKLTAHFPATRRCAYLLANKPLDRNHRLYRVTTTLSDHFDEVHVFGRTKPLDDLVAPGVTYHQVNIAS